jgi:hypothetical protein
MTKCGEKKKVILKCGMTKLFEVFAEAWHVQCMSGLFFYMLLILMFGTSFFWLLLHDGARGAKVSCAIAGQFCSQQPR